MDYEERVLRRREFLARTASAAGLAGLATTLSPDAVLAHAARRGRHALPSPRNMELDHVVILMMENRSFDHYFGWLENADGLQHQTFVGPDGKAVDTFHYTDLPGNADEQGCGHPDPGHGWGDGREQYKNGFLYGGNDAFALSYYNKGDLGFIHAAAKAYTTYDRYFCSLLASTWPNRYYKWSASSGGHKDNTPPVATAGNQWPTIFDSAIAAGLTANYYASDLPFAAVWGPRAAPWCRPAYEYFADCALGTLPNITIIDPPFRDGGGFDGNSADEHPHGDVRLGQAFMADVVNAFVQSPCYRNGALFVVYDEWGGFFDHVTPPRVPDERASSNFDEDFGQLGFRTPTVAISPWTRNLKKGCPARVSHCQYSHESILKLISYRWGLAPLNIRHASTANIGESFNWDKPDFDAPDLPDPAYIVSRPCTLGGGSLTQEAEQAHRADIDNLEDLAQRFRLPVYTSTPDMLFRRPHAVRSAYLAPVHA